MLKSHFHRPNMLTNMFTNTNKNFEISQYILFYILKFY